VILANAASTGSALNIVPTFPFLRRIALHSMVSKLITLDQEVKTNGTLYGIPLNPHPDNYDAIKAAKAISKLRRVLNKYRTP
jgi:hypothetical protein